MLIKKIVLINLKYLYIFKRATYVELVLHFQDLAVNM